MLEVMQVVLFLGLGPDEFEVLRQVVQREPVTDRETARNLVALSVLQEKAPGLLEPGVQFRLARAGLYSDLCAHIDINPR